MNLSPESSFTTYISLCLEVEPQEIHGLQNHFDHNLTLEDLNYFTNASFPGPQARFPNNYEKEWQNIKLWLG